MMKGGVVNGGWESDYLKGFFSLSHNRGKSKNYLEKFEFFVAMLLVAA
jgi:hypothetical protein